MNFIEQLETKAGIKYRYNFHNGQYAAWNSLARFVSVIAGTQGGKTSFGPLWLQREIQLRGPGDYMVVTPTFPLLSLKALPEFKQHFEQRMQLGTYKGSPIKQFTISESGQMQLWGKVYKDIETKIFFGHAQDPESLESATAKAAWLDEAGQNKFKLGSWQAILRRLSIHEGRVLITTTPYNLGWLYTEIYQKRSQADREVVRFRSIDNPVFPRSEWDRAKAELPTWKFNLFYEALFTRPAGLIYDCLDETKHICKPFDIPRNWPRFVGLDFGAVNTAAVFFALNPSDKKLYAYREYKHSSRTAMQHIEAMRIGEPKNIIACGGAQSEQNWRDEFTQAGLKVNTPNVRDVELGIGRVYAGFKTDRLVFFDNLSGTLEELRTYARKLNDKDEPTEDIENKSDYHYLDAVRYIVSSLLGPATGDIINSRARL